jgi:predicted peptidase
VKIKINFIIVLASLILAISLCSGFAKSDEKHDFLESTIPEMFIPISVNTPTVYRVKTMPSVAPNMLIRKQGNVIMPLDCDAGIYREKYTSSSGKNIEYMIRIPQKARTNMPLIIWLHGLNQYSRVLHHNMGVIKMAEELCENRFIILQPSGTTSWYVKSQESLTIELIDAIIDQYQINPDRVILVGFSLGSVAAWQYAEHYPDKWAAVVPVSGQPFIKFDKLVKSNLPIWAIWSNWDTKDNRDEMKKAIKVMNESGTHCEVRSTEIKGITHSDMAFTPFTEEFFDWAIMQRK